MGLQNTEPELEPAFGSAKMPVSIETERFLQKGGTSFIFSGSTSNAHQFYNRTF